jgi:glyoxylase-like metal-dependent hydrolase (beta-lactamase superfamily II)
MSGEKATTTLPPPAADQAYMDVSALEAGNINLPIDKLIADTEPEIVSVPSLAFSLRHSKTGFQLVFDLGTRRDFEGYPPATQQRIQRLGFSPTVTHTVAESLEKGGVAPHEVDAVIVSHLHWDQ